MIGAGLSAIGAIYGGIEGARAAKKAKGYIEQKREENKDWYNRRYNEDATQRADAQALLTRTAEIVKNRNNAAAGRAAVMGGSAEAVEAEKAKNNEAIAQATAKIAADAEARKENIEDTYMKNDDAYAQQLMGIEAGKAKAIAGAMQGVGKAAVSIGDSLSLMEEKEEEKL